MGAFALPVASNLLTSSAAAAGATAAGAGAGTAALTPALFSNPVTAIAGAGLLAFQLIDGIFTAHHAKAVQTEAQALNSAVPAVEESISGTFDLLNKGQITPQQAHDALETLTPAYNDLVYKQYGVKQKAGNGPDTVLKDWITPDITKAEALIASGQAGDLQLDAIPGHAGFAGIRPVGIHFAGANPWTVPSAVASTPAPVAAATTPVMGTADLGATGTAVAPIPALTAAPSAGINWGSVLLWGGLILVAIWLFSGKGKR